MPQRTGPLGRGQRGPSPASESPQEAPSAQIDPVQQPEPPSGLARQPSSQPAFARPSSGEPTFARQSSSEPTVSGEDRIGDPTVDAATLRRMGNLVATRHLMTLLASRRHALGRDGTVEAVARLLLDLEDPAFARRVLLQMGEIGRIIDIYPLEVMVRVLERRKDALATIGFGPVISNRASLEGRAWPTGDILTLKVPLGLRLRGFALEGGGAPGYVLVPGPPATYLLEFELPGVYTMLFRGLIRKEHRVERMTLRFSEG